MSIHSSAIIGPKAKIAKDVNIGPFTIIEDDVNIARGVTIGTHAYVCRGTEIGEGTQVHMGAVLGHTPQDIAFERKKSFLRIGKNNIIREYVTIHRGTKEGSATLIGDNNFLMALSHVGHNCYLGNNITMVNGSLLAGYVRIEDDVFISGNTAIHQFVRIGKLAMIGGVARVSKDVPPYMLVKGDSLIYSLNLVGLRRAGFSEEVKSEIKKAYKILYRMNLNMSQALEKMEKELKRFDEIKHLIEFIRSSERGISSHVNIHISRKESDN